MIGRKSRVSFSDIAGAILVLRGARVLLDNELASLYQVTTKALNQAEIESVNRSRSVTGSQRHRDPRFPPAAFTEHGAIMTAAVPNSARAVETSVLVIRAFMRMHALLASNEALAPKVDELDRKYRHHDKTITVMLTVIRDLMNPPPP